MAHYPKIFDFASTPIDVCQIAWGTGGGITSSNYFVFDCSRINLVMGGTSSLNSATNSVYLSSIIGGVCNKISVATSSSIISSGYSCINNDNSQNALCYSSIIASKNSCMNSASSYSVIIGGTGSVMDGSSSTGTILGSFQSYLIDAYKSAIINSHYSKITYASYDSTILSGIRNEIVSSQNSLILSGKKNYLSDANISGIILSEDSNLKKSDNSFILGSMTGSVICDSNMSSIITSYMSCIRGSSNSVIIGGVGGTNSSLPLNYYGSVWNGTQIIEGNNNVIVGGGTYLNTGYFINSYPNRICKAYASSIISGRLNIINNLNPAVNALYSYANIAFSGIFSGEKNTICTENSNSHLVRSSAIVAGSSNKIMSSWLPGNSINSYRSDYSTIIGGVANCIGNSMVSLISSSRISCIIASQSLSAPQIQNTILSSQQGMICGRVCGNMIFGSNNVCIKSVNDSRSYRNNIISSVTSQICAINLPELSGKAMVQSSIQNSGVALIVDSEQILIMNSLGVTVSNACLSHLLSTRDSIICNSMLSGIISSSFSTICDSVLSSIISASGSCILNSSNSLILGGKGLTISNEKDVVYVSTLKINSVTQSIDTNRVLVWDCDSCVRYTTINAAGVIDICEIAWGTGVGITSSDHFRFDCQRCNLLMGCNQGLTFTHASSSYWSVNLGKGCNCITNSNSAVILGGCKQTVATGSYSSIIGGHTNIIWCSNYSNILGGKALTITQSDFSTIINGSSSQIKSPFSTIVSGICQCIDTNSKYSSIVSGKCGCITTSDYSTIVGGFAGNSKNTIRNSDCSLILNSTCFSLIGTSSCSMISNAFCSKIEDSKSSLILGGCCDCIIDQSYRSLIFGVQNTIDSSKDSIVFGHRNNCICNNSQCSTIISGCKNVIINNASDSIIIQGFDNCIVNSGFKNSIFGSDLSVINTSCLSTIIASYKSCTFNTKWSGIIASSQSYILGEVSLSSCQIKSSIIVGGIDHLMCNSSYSSIMGGYKNCLCETKSGSIISSINSRMVTKSGTSCLSGIITSCCAETINSKSSTIISSWESADACSYQSVIIAATNSNSTKNKASALLSSVDSNINDSLSSAIVSSERSLICSATNSAIIGSSASYICTSQNSAIIGGRGLTLSNENQVVYIPELKINKVDQCVTLSKFLVWDDANKYVRWANSALEPGITGSTIFYTGTNWTYSSTNIYNNGTYVGIGLTNSLNNTYATPSSNLHVFGSLSLDVKTASSNYTLTDKNFTLIAYAPSTGGMTVSLPSASLAKHRLYVIKKADAFTQSFVYISPSGANTIEGYAGSITLENQWDYNILQSDGVSMWIKLGGAVGLNL